MVSVYKESVENVLFSQDIDYELWDKVISFTPVTQANEEQTQAEPESEAAETETEADFSDRSTE